MPSFEAWSYRYGQDVRRFAGKLAIGRSNLPWSPYRREEASGRLWADLSARPPASADAVSVMFAALPAVVAKRSLTAQDLGVLDAGGGTGEPQALHALIAAPARPATPAAPPAAAAAPAPGPAPAAAASLSARAAGRTP